MACHAPGGVGQASEGVPLIAGQPFTTVEDALMLFSAGNRPCTVMCAIAAGMNPGEMEALAEKLEQLPYVPADQEFDPDLASHGGKLHLNSGCDACHSRGGQNGQGMAPVLAGQRTSYLRQALLQVRAGLRKGPRVMNQAVRKLDDDEIEALLHFYAGNRAKPACGARRTDTAGPCAGAG